MTWRPDTVFGADTYDAMLARIRATTDACFDGPEAFFDPDRAERWDDYAPAADLARASQSLASVQRAGIRRLPGNPGIAAARWGATGVRQHPDEEAV